MEDTATVIDPGTAPEAQSKETESAAPAPEAQAAAPASKPDVKALLKREKDDPYTVFNNAELDVLEAHWDAEEKGKGKAPTPKAEPKDPEEAEKPDKEPEAKPEKVEIEEESDPEQGEETPEAKALLKEVGAKNLKEAAQKVKDLRALVGGKDAQAVARVTKERDEVISQGKNLMTALAKGDPAAIAFAEKTWPGMKFATSQPSPVQQKPVSAGDRFIDPAKFIDPESADLVEAAFQRQAAEIKALKDDFGVVKQERDRHIQTTTREKALGSVVDEMAQIAQYIPELKAIPGFREAAQAVLNGTPDPRFAVVEELFEIAKGIKGATLKDAFDIKRGRDSDRRELVAKQQGLKEAYDQKPNPSLSGKAGGKGEGYQPVTDADLERWSEDFTTHPASWYNKSTGKLDMSKVPKRAHKIFDPA